MYIEQYRSISILIIAFCHRSMIYTLSELCKWFQANELTLNVNETRNYTDQRIIIDGTEIERVYCNKYLGKYIYLDDKLNWVPHVNYIINKLLKLKGAFHYISQYVYKPYMKQIYYEYSVFPYIRYGVELYGTCANSVMKKLQTKQNKLFKIVYQKDLKYSTNAPHIELQLLKCQYIYTSSVLIFVYKQ